MKPEVKLSDVYVLVSNVYDVTDDRTRPQYAYKRLDERWHWTPNYSRAEKFYAFNEAKARRRYIAKYHKREVAIFVVKFQPILKQIFPELGIVEAVAALQQEVR